MFRLGIPSKVSPEESECIHAEAAALLEDQEVSEQAKLEIKRELKHVRIKDYMKDSFHRQREYEARNFCWFVIFSNTVF